MTPNPSVPTEKGIENTENYNIAAGLQKSAEKSSSYAALFTDRFTK